MFKNLLIIGSLMLIGSSAYNINRNPNLLASVNKGEYWVCNYKSHTCSRSYNYVSGSSYNDALQCARACLPKPYFVKNKGYMHGWDFYCAGNNSIQGCICKQRVDVYSKYGDGKQCQAALDKEKGIAQTKEEVYENNKKETPNKQENTSKTTTPNMNVSTNTGTGPNSANIINKATVKPPTDPRGYKNGYTLVKSISYADGGRRVTYKCVLGSNGYGKYPGYNSCQQAIRDLTPTK